MKPQDLHLDRERGLTIRWTDGSESFFPIDYLRHMSPSAEQRTLREEMQRNPLVVIPNRSTSGPLLAEGAELVGRYAVRIRFSDGHDTGIYTWQYLREIDPENEARATTGESSVGDRTS